MKMFLMILSIIKSVKFMQIIKKVDKMNKKLFTLSCLQYIIQQYFEYQRT